MHIISLRQEKTTKERDGTIVGGNKQTLCNCARSGSGGAGLFVGLVSISFNVAYLKKETKTNAYENY